MQSRNVNDTAEYHLNEGLKLQAQGKYADAIEQFSKAIALDKDNAVIYGCRGYAYTQLKKYNEAIVDCDMAIKLISNFSTAYSNRAYAYNGLKKYTEAIADCDMAIKFNPNFSEAYCNRACTYFMLGKYPEAITECNKAIRLNLNQNAAYDIRGHAYEKQGKHAEAIADYKKALAINPDCAKTKSTLKDAEKAQSEHKLSLLSQRSKDSFAALNGNPPSAMPAALLSMMSQENELLDALLEHTKKSDELSAGTAINITAAINQWRHYPLVACPQPSKEIPSLTPHINDFLRRKEAINRYIASIRQALLEIKDDANTFNWKIKLWLTGTPIPGTPRHIKLIKDLLSPINEHSSTEAVMNAYKEIISLLPTTPKKSRLQETSLFYDKVNVTLNNIMFNPPSPPSYAEHMAREQEQLSILNTHFPNYTITIQPDAYFLKNTDALYPVTISKLRFNEDVAEKSKPVEVRPAPLFSAAECAATAQTPPSAVAAPVISSSPSSIFAAKPAPSSAADAATVDPADALERQLPPVPTHALPEVKSPSDKADAPAQRQMVPGS